MKKGFLGLFFVPFMAFGQQVSLGEIAEERLKQLMPILQGADAAAVVMDATFQVVCPTGSATSFVVARERGDVLEYFLVSAAHVFKDCAEKGNDTITIRFRRRRSSFPPWEIDERPIKITLKKKPQWVRHTSADVAAIPIAVPEGLIEKPLLINQLADGPTLDAVLRVGRAVFAMGYPFGKPSQSGFPMLRSALVTSRELDKGLPVVLSFNLYPGDSGGPVYSVWEAEGRRNFVVVGVMIQTSWVPGTVSSASGKRRDVMIITGLGYVVTAVELYETLNLLFGRADARLHEAKSK